jgi:hypothetical protein
MATLWWRPIVNANWSDVLCSSSSGKVFATVSNVCTVTSVAHALRAGKDIVNISASDATASLPDGDYLVQTTPTADTYTLTTVGASDGVGTATWAQYVWYTAENGGGTTHSAVKPGASDTVYFSSTASSMNCTLTGNEDFQILSTCTSVTGANAGYAGSLTGGTTNWNGTLAIGVYDFGHSTSQITLGGIDVSNKINLTQGVTTNGSSGGIIYKDFLVGNVYTNIVFNTNSVSQVYGSHCIDRGGNPISPVSNTGKLYFRSNCTAIMGKLIPV